MPMSLRHAPQAHHLIPAPENLANGVRVTPCHGTGAVLPQSVPVHVVAHPCRGSGLQNGTAREHELAALASHLQLPVLSCSCKGGPAAYPTFQVHATVKVSHQRETDQRPPFFPFTIFSLIFSLFPSLPLCFTFFPFSCFLFFLFSSFPFFFFFQLFLLFLFFFVFSVFPFYQIFFFFISFSTFFPFFLLFFHSFFHFSFSLFVFFLFFLFFSFLFFLFLHCFSFFP